MRAPVTWGTPLSLVLQPCEAISPRTGMVELSTGEKGTMLSATPSHVQEQAMFLKREGDRRTHEHLGNIQRNQGPGWR